MPFVKRAEFDCPGCRKTVVVWPHRDRNGRLIPPDLVEAYKHHVRGCHPARELARLTKKRVVAERIANAPPASRKKRLAIAAAQEREIEARRAASA